MRQVRAENCGAVPGAVSTPAGVSMASKSSATALISLRGAARSRLPMNAVIKHRPGEVRHQAASIRLSRLLTKPGPSGERLRDQKFGDGQAHRLAVPGAIMARNGSSASLPRTSASFLAASTLAAVVGCCSALAQRSTAYALQEQALGKACGCRHFRPRRSGPSARRSPHPCAGEEDDRQFGVRLAQAGAVAPARPAARRLDVEDGKVGGGAAVSAVRAAVPSERLRT